jgi:carboxymethylenebutenolidase
MSTETIHTRDIPSDRMTVPAFLALPEGQGPFPGIVVIHEIYGLTENIKEITRRFAHNGYAALAVDLFGRGNRAICMARIMAGQLTGSVQRYGVRDLRGALSYLSDLPEVDGQRVGAIGFCLGGGYAIAWACTDKRLQAIAPFYGSNPRPLEAVARSCPVVGSYPERDFTARSGRRLERALLTHGIPHDIKIYAGVRHSFFNDQGHSYDADAAADAWQRVLAFFGAHVARRPE